MEQSYAAKYHKLEEKHWWFLGRRDIIYKLIKGHRRDVEILEIGCSGGVLIEFLKGRGFTRLHGIDIDERAIEICRQRGIKDVSVADAQETGFKDQQFDILIASDILEHIRDEDKALLEWHRILKPGGKLLIFVPAFKFLWSRHDEVNHHYRRYSKSGLVKTVEKSGFKIEKVSYWDFSLFLPVSLVRLSQRFLSHNRKIISLNPPLLKGGRGDLKICFQEKRSGNLYETTPFMNKALEYILRLENKFLSGGVNFPLGVSIFAIARKR